jgi:arginase
MFDRDFPGNKKKVGIIGVPLGFGAEKRGSSLGTRTIRQAKRHGKILNEHIAELGYEVQDWADLDLPRPIGDSHERPKFLSEMIASAQKIVPAIKEILQAGEMPVILGGDHSIALSTFSAISAHFRANKEEIGLIWFDAHADMNTPETSPSGNIHGMPLATLFGRGVAEFVNLEGFAPKINPQFFAHIGARDLDLGEKQMIRELGLRDHFFTMHEIDRFGMNSCVEKAIEIASQASGGFAVTFDVDVLDPLDAPGSGTLVRGGISYREAHLALERIAETRKMQSFEIVEINPTLDTNNRTSELAVELILSALGKTIL